MSTSITLYLSTGYLPGIGICREFDQIKSTSNGTKATLFTGIFVDLNHRHFLILLLIDDRFCVDYIQEYNQHKRKSGHKNVRYRILLIQHYSVFEIPV
jgi:hypothetical protein